MESTGSSLTSPLTVAWRPVGPAYYVYYPTSVASTLAVLQLICGMCIALVMVAPAAMLGMRDVWQAMVIAGVLAMIAGFVGAFAGKLRISTLVSATMFLSIFAAISAGVCFVVCIVSTFASDKAKDFDEKHYFVGGFTALICFVEIGLAIASSVIASHFSCILWENSCCQKSCGCNFDISRSQKVIIRTDLSSEQVERVIMSTVNSRKTMLAMSLVEQQQQQQQQQALLQHQQYVASACT